MDQNSMMGGYPPIQGQGPMSTNNGFGGGMNPAPVAPNQPNQMPPMNTGIQMPAPGMPNMAPNVAAAEQNKDKNSLIETIILVVVCVIAAIAIIVAVLFFVRWNELNTNYTAEKDRAVAEAVKEQSDTDAKNLDEQLKRETVQFTGPDDFGRISFYYPKIWSVYEDKDGSQNSDYAAYIGPAPVHSVNDNNSRYAIRFQILQQSFDDVAKNYASAVSEGNLTAQPFSADSDRIAGTRYDGKLEEGIDGILVLAKVNNNTLLLQADSKEVYEADFTKMLSTLRRGN